MTRNDGLPRRVYLKSGRYYYVTPGNVWKGLTREKEGLPAMYRALAALTESARTADMMPAVIARWLDERSGDWATKTQTDMARVSATIAKRFADFTPALVTTKVCAEYLKPLRKTGRTHNVHRSVLRMVLAYAAVEGLREGHNPIDNIPAVVLEKRVRTVTDDEVKALRAAALLQSRNGEALVQMIDLALLTGQRIGDVLKMRWQDVGEEGIRVVQGKGKGRVSLLIEWSPALRAAVDACAEGRDRIGHLLKTQSGTGYRYAGIRSAWVRACARAGIEGLHIHDLRGRAGVDAMGEGEDIRAAQKLLGHSGEAMTRHYVEGKFDKRTKPAK